jgi:hypothetical protein
MEKIFFDQSPSTLDVSLSRSNKSMNSYSSLSSSSSSYSPYSSGNSLSHLLYSYNVAAMPKLNSEWPLSQIPPVPLSPSLYSSIPLPQPNQPPLLPLPLHKTSSFPSQLNQKRFTPSAPKRKPRANKKERRVQTKNTKIPLERKPSLISPADDMTNDENNMDEEILIKSQAKDRDILDCYSISPPPSSLPLPGLALLRPKMKITTACNRETVFEEAKLINSGVDNGATDNLRRILRL